MFKKFGLAAVAVLMLGISSAKADKYDDCMASAGSVSDVAMAKCMTDRTNEYLQDIKYLYELLLKEDAFAKWSGGAGMQDGNLRSMFDNWLSYRDRYCSIYTISMSNYVGSDAYNQASCLLDYTEDHKARLNRLLANIKSEVY